MIFESSTSDPERHAALLPEKLLGNGAALLCWNLSLSTFIVAPGSSLLGTVLSIRSRSISLLSLQSLAISQCNQRGVKCSE
jgi:hypothetical protein